MYRFRWIPWNIDHIGTHGVTQAEAESIVNFPGRGYPRRAQNAAYLVWGQTTAGRYLQVIYIIDPPPENTLFIIHARNLTARERHQLRRRKGR